MLSLLRNRFGIPGVISVLALIFAMIGGAYAANHSGGSGKATASAKAKRGPRGPKGPAGPQGPAGPAGPAGAAGAKGLAGAQGPVGAEGKEGPQGKEGKQGAKGATGAAGVAGAKGATGFSGFTETLPSGKTETGMWSFGFTTAATVQVLALSFPIPLAEPLGIGAENAYYVTRDEVDGGTAPPACPGSQEDPSALPGSLCIYEGETVGLGTRSINTYTTGAQLSMNAEAAGAYGIGSFAVTAP